MKVFNILRSDFLSIIREPVIALITLTPLFMVLVFKALMVFLLPYIIDFIPLNIDIRAYILVTLLLATPIMMGVVMGFMMLDDRDGRMIELYYVTPLGKSGYLMSRILFSSLLTLFYTGFNYGILGVYSLNLWEIAFVGVLCSFFAGIIGLLFFSLASDKIKGLTYAKGLNILMLFGFSELIDVNWFQYLSLLFPTYWISLLIRGSSQYLESLLVILVWFAIMVYYSYKKITYQ